MPLSNENSPGLDQYQVRMTQGMLAKSPAEALAVFFHQIGTGEVEVRVSNNTRDEVDVLDDLHDEPAFSQINLAIIMMQAASTHLTAHERIELCNSIKKILLQQN